MFIKLQGKSRRGYTIVEVLIASAIMGIASLALGSIYLFSTRSFAVLANYAQLDQINRNAMDSMTREIREAHEVISYNTNATGIVTSINLINNSGISVTYSFDTASGKLIRACEGQAAQTILSSCKVLQFDVRQRTAENGSWDEYPPIAAGDSVQVVRLTWQASRTIPGANIPVSENIQTARVVIRNQHHFGN